MEEKVEQNSRGKVIIPKEWRKKMALKDGSVIELKFDKNVIKLKKNPHPLEDCIGLFDGTEFTEEDHENAKKITLI